MKDEKRNPSGKEVMSDRRKSTENILKEKKREEAGLKRQLRGKNREYRIVSGFFVLIFFSLIVYVSYFNLEKSQEFINSPYNTRQNTFADRVVRGKIESSDGETLAFTQVNEDGSEKRVYPYARMFSHVIGYDSNGKSGLESQANFQLLSSHSFLLRQMKNQLGGRKNTGDTIVSTLDYTIQNTAYKALGDRQGAIIAIEPSTGRILAMVSKPDFDPNTIDADWEYYLNDTSSSNLLNRATQGQYPPGSTFKIVTTLDYIRENGKLNQYSFNCNGTITRSDHTIRCYNGNVHGSEDLYTAFANSCNTAYASMGVDLGGGSMRAVAETLLFNQKIPFAGAKRSIFSLDQNSPIPLIMQTSIGQGNTLVSPFHMALITAAIANHGVLMEPRLIDVVKNDEGMIVSREKSEVYKRLMTNKEAEILNEMMQKVVSQGTATSLSGRSYSVAGKTGSAEFDANGSSHSWFVGYCNAQNPDLVVAVIVENGGTGSTAAVPIAGQLFDAYYISQASKDAENNTVDYSNYDDSISDSTDNGWFDIVEEEYMEYNQQEYEEWEQIYDWHYDENPVIPTPEIQITDIPEVGNPDDVNGNPDEWEVFPGESETITDPEGGNDWNQGSYPDTPEDFGPEPPPDTDRTEDIWEEENYSDDEVLFNVEMEDSGEYY